MTCTRCQHGNAKKFGTYGKRHIQRYRCNACSATFAEPQPANSLGNMRTDLERASKALQCLLERCSVRSTERLTGLNRNTILSLLVIAGDKCQQLMDAKMRGLNCRYIQADELWSFVQKKKRNVRTGDPAEYGDAWIFLAMDAESKLVPCFKIGKRSRAMTHELMGDLAKRLASRSQITTDGLRFYVDAVEENFGADVDFAQVVKLFGDYGQHDSEGKYSPSPIVEVISKVRSGDPDPEHISTSYIERQNLTLRMQLRRLTRLTNGFSKKLANLKAAVALHFAYYNFCRVHKSLRVTPAMEAGISDHVWTLAELLASSTVGI